MTIRLRFVKGSALSSELIELREGTCMPFAPSHVECVWTDKDGKTWYIGQHIDGGMQARPVRYDGAKPDEELFLDLSASDEQTEDFYSFVITSIGEPYDWQSIMGFVAPGHHHLKFHAICSAKMTQGLRRVDWFPSRLPLCVPFHCIDPRDLLLILSSIVNVPHEYKVGQGWV